MPTATEHTTNWSQSQDQLVAKLRTLAQRAGSVRRLAISAGLNPRTVQHYFDRGSEPTAAALAAIARAAGVTVDWLLGEEHAAVRLGKEIEKWEERNTERLTAAALGLKPEELRQLLERRKSKLARFFERAEAETAKDFEHETGVRFEELSARTQAALVVGEAPHMIHLERYSDLFAAEVIDLERERRERALVKRFRRRHPPRRQGHKAP